MTVNGEEKCYRVIRHILGPIIRDVADLDSIFPAAGDVDDVKPDA